MRKFAKYRQDWMIDLADLLQGKPCRILKVISRRCGPEELQPLLAGSSIVL
jgi:hypothetical protein